MRLILPVLICLANLFLSSGVRAEQKPLYFLAMGLIKADKVQSFDKFLKQVTPIWQRHGMRPLFRGRPIDLHGPKAFLESRSSAFNDITLLKAASRQQFQNYLQDPYYRAVRELRLDASESFVVLEGMAESNAGEGFLSKTPLVAIKLRSDSESAVDTNLTLTIDLAGQIKGPVPDYLETIKTVDFHAVSFDDNPASFIPDSGSGASLIILESLK